MALDNENVEKPELGEEREQVQSSFGGDAILHTSAQTVEETAPVKESILFFISAMGCTLGWTAVLSNLVFYTDTLGIDSFLILNLAVFSPLLPVTVAQAIWDSKLDKQFKSLRSFSFRGNVGYSTTFLCLLLLPWASTSLNLLAITSLLLGFSSAILHGMLKQMASFIYPNCGRLSAAVTAGLQASAVLVLIVSVVSGFGRRSNKDGLKAFYFSNAAILVICWLSFHSLLYSSRGVLRSMSRRDSLFEGNEAETPLLPRPAEYDSLDADGQELSLWQLSKKSWPVGISIMLTVSSSMAVSSWFNRFESADVSNQSFPQLLFYTRIFSDLLGRPSTLYLTSQSPTSIFTASTLRLLLSPLFFIYSSTTILPKNDSAVIVSVFLFSFTSGFLVTRAYQLAPSLLNDQERERNLTKQTSLLSVFFSISVLLGLFATFALRAVL
eukprot:CAMPEP_0194206554 /NCGR_PEP_ID=MMETSP0156-20130528/5539_1 /TAXON_ID=33649 /ORGANISM="Thalassionema nitzschioides, Strain L26-B" /LENGTH=439 /DNA_ID=CAMNT_0038933097 /DNA_START=33 /DNA_END=1352 /DNA_ORIENTATION=+